MWIDNFSFIFNPGIFKSEGIVFSLFFNTNAAR
jgi:hypothetical protein